ncbi:DUF5060 domain-containing protein [Maribacter algarum]|uniref:DUF5060 domain-containing protein n=1 Tax=Maribacter algarum (ex Zhang et al. 2020) TaxID=2578118 RepID=A0A5S3PTZ9_9FLAO|nr:DUF5060 domain-containing protein [Maribacter algarum]TMM58420.1 DUF5060 domain-containing protein [Maribacter algarum]
MKKTVILFGIFLIFLQNHRIQAQKVLGELKKWHKVTLVFEGPETSENAEENPFLSYRLNVTFTNGRQNFVVPGFYSADGNASETSSNKGNVWKVRFRPNMVGQWDYKVSFRKGKEIAVSDKFDAGEAVAFDGLKGSFNIDPSNKKGIDFRAKGRLKYVGERYLQFEGTKEYFIKGGAGSPENLLGYYEFDQTPASHKYQSHAKDWRDGDPTWQNGKGKSIIGVMNYLASKGMNSMYFLTMNVQGDGNDVWPWNNINERYRFDCSKLDQWEILFDHMDSLGIMLHIFTQETENELLLDIGQTKTQRKLYYRELIARFANHLGVTWNLGEENGYVRWSPKAQDDNDRKKSAEYIRTNDPYKNHIAVHTHAQTHEHDPILKPLLGYEHLTGPSIQLHHPHEVNTTTQKWIRESQKAGHQWVVPLDEIGPANVGAKPDVDDPNHDEMRSQVLWGNLMAGGFGVEWYFGYKFAHMDLNCEDLRSRDLLWDQTRHALEFFRVNLPFNKMKAANGLTDNVHDFVFAENGNVYAIYMPKVEATEIDLTGAKTTFPIKWYNPRLGGPLQKGSVRSVKGGAKVNIGYPPSKDKDWVALLKAKRPVTTSAIKSIKKGMSLHSLSDFQINPSSATSTYYKDEKNKALAIDAANKSLRNKFAQAKTVFNGERGMYRLSLATMTENDGESSYVVKVNGSVLDTLVNPPTNDTYDEVNHNFGEYFVATNDIIQVESMAVTNGKIPENDETAWSRGRWNRLIFAPSNLSMEEEMESAVPFTEKDGIIVVEAEDYQYRSDNGTPRNWYIRPADVMNMGDLENHVENASGGKYIEALPDTRVTHDDNLMDGVNFFPKQGTGGLVAYKVNISEPGKYYIWARAFSSGSEDNGVHVGLDGKWPESGARMQWCEGKNKWTWSSAQRVPQNHCGIPNAIYLDIKTAGEHIITFAMREDGFELDKWIMTRDENYIPK